MPSGINKNDDEAPKEKSDINQTESVIIDKTDGQNLQTLEASSSPAAIFMMENTGGNKNGEKKTNNHNNKGRKRVNYYRELWSESENSVKRKKTQGGSEIKKQDESVQFKPCFAEPKQKGCKRPQRKHKCPSRSAAKKPSCRKPYYRKRRYCCPGKRRYRASKRCCPKRYNRNKINLCNRNWARISINPFINFLREFRRKFCKGTSITEIARKGKAEWKKMTCNSKKRFYEQAKRARIRGYRT